MDGLFRIRSGKLSSLLLPRCRIQGIHGAANRPGGEFRYGEDGAWAAFVPSQTGRISLEGCTLSRRMPPSAASFTERGEMTSTTYFGSRHNNTVEFIQDAFRNDLEVEGGVFAAE
jgi:hypothetical protein